MQGVALAHGNTDLVVVEHRVAFELEAFAGIALQPFPVDKLVGQHAIDTAGGQVEVGVFLGVVELDLDDIRHVVFQPGTGDGGALGTDHFALEAGLVDLEVAAFRGDELQLVGVVSVGEIDRSLALFGDRHGGDDGVELLRVQGRDDAVPVGGDHFTLGFHLGAQGQTDIDIEAARLAAGINQVERWVGAFGADFDFFSGHSAAAKRQSSGSGQQDLLVVLHAM